MNIEHILGSRDTQVIKDALNGKPFTAAPRHLEIHVTNRCNARCSFCNQVRFQKGKEELSFEAFRDIITEARHNGLEMIRLSGGGEPTFHPDILRMLDLLGDAGVMLENLSTNGILLGDVFFDRLRRCRTRCVSISLNSPDAKTWSRINGRRTQDFHQVIENIRGLKEYDKSNAFMVSAVFLINELTYKELPQMARLCKDLGIHLFVQDLNNYRYPAYFKSRCVPRFLQDLFELEGVENIMTLWFCCVQEFYDMKNILGSFLKKPGQKDDRFCFIPWTSALIRPNGDVYPCCHSSSPQMLMGNVFKDKFMDIWQGEGYKALRTEYREALFGPKASGPFTGRYFSEEVFQICPIKYKFGLSRRAKAAGHGPERGTK